MQTRKENKEDSFIDQLKSYEINQKIIKIQTHFKKHYHKRKARNTCNYFQAIGNLISSDKTSYPK